MPFGEATTESSVPTDEIDKREIYFSEWLLALSFACWGTVGSLKPLKRVDFFYGFERSNMTTVQDIIGDYTPLANRVVKKLKLVRGAILCKIFYTSNLRDRVCRMGLTRISNDLGINHSTASKNIAWLVNNGYVEHIRQHTTTEPAHYRCTQKFYDLAKGIDLINTPVDLINTPVDLINQEEETKIESKDNTAAEKKPLALLLTKPLNQYTPQQLMFGHLAMLYQIDLQLMSKKQEAQLGKEATKLIKAGKQPDDIKLFEDWWYKHDWRGQKGQPPIPFQASELWGQFESSRNGNNPAQTNQTKIIPDELGGLNLG
jgi:hypothetical protein